MVKLQECLEKLANFKLQFGDSFGITKLGIFGSVARGENTEDSDRYCCGNRKANSLAHAQLT